MKSEIPKVKTFKTNIPLSTALFPWRIDVLDNHLHDLWWGQFVGRLQDDILAQNLPELK